MPCYEDLPNFGSSAELAAWGTKLYEGSSCAGVAAITRSGGGDFRPSTTTSARALAAKVWRASAEPRPVAGQPFLTRTHAMRAIEIVCVDIVPGAPAVITEHVADVARWSEFRGYGLIPGIANARYEFRAPNQTGSRVRVRNTDGSTHAEEFLEWESGRRVLIRMSEFSAPLNWLASDFLEEWDLTPVPAGTRITRRLSLRPRNLVGRVVLFLIAPLLTRAVSRHLEQIGRGADQTTPAQS